MSSLYAHFFGFKLREERAQLRLVHARAAARRVLAGPNDAARRRRARELARYPLSLIHI